MPTLESLQNEIDALKARNAKVEANKAWETSSLRIGTIVGITYFVAVLLMISLGTPQPFFAALMPTVGFFLSTQTLPVLQRWYLRKRAKRI
jgi:hypothetical protein